MKRRHFEEFYRRVKRDAKRFHRHRVRLLNAKELYEKAYIDFVETGMISHAFFFVYYRRLFEQYLLDRQKGIVL